VKGILKEKEEARNTYDDAIASGHGAYLLEQKSEETFSANIGNLPAGKEVIVWITYVMELEFNDAGQLRLVIPEQKFAPNGKDTLTFPAPSTADAIANQQTVPAGLTIDVQFEMTSAISQIICESHPKAIKSEIFSGNPRRGSLKMPTTPNPLVEDLEILIQLEDPSKLSAVVQKNEKGEKVAMVSFWPRLADFEPLGEIVFLVDRSGSMQGTKMRRTIETMQIFLRSLSPGIKFNIVSFGSTFTQLFPSSTEYDEVSLAKATELVSKMSANMGTFLHDFLSFGGS
jgi:von Willebrand factor A domain-containing protein 5